ncbi:MAG TPA: TAXI family TRAP transporter solute-binding subunit [Lamprocystis sp. (in: g-proteobacteria)]|nr:TAXI family TRAP transporter solute-binding subunit [Lamprocystis sp. (in: g-proteobacteria)]
MYRLRLYTTLRWFTIGLAALILSACQEAPDAQQVTQTVLGRLGQAFGADTFALTSLRRLGSGPLGADGQGRPQRIVYYNAVLTLERDVNFSAWENLNVAAFASLLGATEKGLIGLKQAGNRRGDQVRVHGSASFVRDGLAWTPVEVVLPEVGTPSAPLSPATNAQSQRLFARLMQLYERQTADPKRQGQIIAEELDGAYATITMRLDRLDQTLILAGGPTGGEYLVVAGLLAQALTGQGTAADALTTGGSPQNLGLLRARRADLALVQNNLAAAALLGTGGFEPDGPDHALRALASLFPEPVHVLVAPNARISDLRDLAGKRVEIGLPNSGSRANAIMLLDATGIRLEGLKAVAESGLEQGLADLAAGRVDAVIATISAPARLIQDAAARGEVKLLPLPPELRTALANRSKGLVPMELPPATYPGQLHGVPTLAVTALLVSANTMPAADVERVLRTLFDGTDFLAAGSAAGSRINRHTATTGLTVPLHPAAAAFLATAPAKQP